MEQLKINHLAVWVCVILAHAIGFLWYGFLFEEQWMEAAELTTADIEANPAGAGHWISNLLAIVAPTYTLAWMFTKLNVRSGINGALWGMLIVFVFVQLTLMTTGLFEGENYNLAWINGGSNLITFGIIGFILGAWTKTA